MQKDMVEGTRQKNVPQCVADRKDKEGARDKNEFCRPQPQ